MGIDHNRALTILIMNPDRWVRPATHAQLLSYLFLALKGFAIAVRDDDGYIFRLSHSATMGERVAGPCSRAVVARQAIPIPAVA